jgi:acyl carrier protein
MDAPATLQLDFDANKVRALVARYLGIDVEQLTDEVNFTNEFELDSLNRLELLILIEEEFSGVEFSDAAVDRIEVVDDLIRHAPFARKTCNASAQKMATTRKNVGHRGRPRSSNALTQSQQLALSQKLRQLCHVRR